MSQSLRSQIWWLTVALWTSLAALLVALVLQRDWTDVGVLLVVVFLIAFGEWMKGRVGQAHAGHAAESPDSGRQASDQDPGRNVPVGRPRE